MSESVNALQIKEEKKSIAVEIALNIGLLQKCDDCNEITDPMNNNFDEAHTQANSYMAKNDHLVRFFKDPAELSDLLKKIPEDFSGECYCKRLFND